MTATAVRPQPLLALKRPIFWCAAGTLLLLGCLAYYAARGGFFSKTPTSEVVALLNANDAAAATVAAQNPDDERMPVAPELEGGIAWLNTAGPVRLKDVRGKIVILDFWTLCCINCIHTLPDLARLEKKYPNELVVVGVHSAKFDNEKGSDSIRKAILRYEISHPVVNDANLRLWRAYGARSWPSLYLIDPEGYLVAKGEGEGLHDALDDAIARLIKEHKEKKTLNGRPLRFERARNQE